MGNKWEKAEKLSEEKFKRFQKIIITDINFDTQILRLPDVLMDSNIN